MVQSLFLARLSGLSLGVLTLSVSIAQAAPPAEAIQWMSLEEALGATKKQPKKIFIDLYTDWCGWCKVMDKKTFTDEGVIGYMNEHYYAVKLDGEQKEAIEFQGQTFHYVPTGRGGYQEFAAFLTQGELSYPTSILLDEDLRLLTRIPGFQRPEKFRKLLAFFGEEHYKRTSWEDFIRQ